MRFPQPCWRSLCVAGALAFGAAVPTSAQIALVKVDVSSVQKQIARQLSVEAQEVPATVYAAIHVAADVCEIDSDLLAGEIKEAGMATCTARSTSTALNQLVERQILD